MRIEIKNDLYEISERLKNLDRRYKVFFDTKLQKFVVEAMGVTAAILPYEELDQRALDYIHYTRAENAETVADDVDRYNDRMQKDSIKSAQNEFEDEFSHEMRLTKEEFVSGSLPTPSGANGGDRV